MKTTDTAPFYAEKHLTCGRYVYDVQNRFIFKEFPAGHIWVRRDGTKRNYLVMLIDGELKIKCNVWTQRTIRSGEMFFVAQTSLVKAEYVKDSRVLIWEFESLSSNCEKIDILNLSEVAKSIDYNMNSLPIRNPLNKFIDLMILYLKNGANCGHLNEAKHYELMFILRCFYTKEELALLLHPMLNGSFDFKHFIHANYKQAKSASDLIALSHLSRSVFYSKFNKAFGRSAKRWMNEKKLYSILYKASDPDYTVKELMFEFNFSSLSRLHLYCKHHFGLAPSELIKACKSGKMPKIINQD